LARSWLLTSLLTNLLSS